MLSAPYKHCHICYLEQEKGSLCNGSSQFKKAKGSSCKPVSLEMVSILTSSVSIIGFYFKANCDMCSAKSISKGYPRSQYQKMVTRKWEGGKNVALSYVTLLCPSSFSSILRKTYRSNLVMKNLLKGQGTSASKISLAPIAFPFYLLLLLCSYQDLLELFQISATPYHLTNFGESFYHIGE